MHATIADIKIRYLFILVKLAGTVADDYIVDLRCVAVLGSELLDSCVYEWLVKLLLHEVDGTSAEAATHHA